jgi:hypothetical protein
MRIGRALVPVAVLAGVAAAVDAVLYVAALLALSGGPSAIGWDALTTANRVALVAALLGAAAGVLASPRRRAAPGFLLAAAAVALTLAVGMRVLGERLASIEPTAQPSNLYVALLAIEGTGSDLLPVPIVLALGGATAVVVGRLLRDRALAA